MLEGACYLTLVFSPITGTNGCRDGFRSVHWKDSAFLLSVAKQKAK